MMNFLFTKTPLMFLVQDFWRDEAFSYLLAKKNIFDLLVLTAKDFNPPLYYLVLHFWIIIFGKSEILLRSVSMLFFISTVYLAIDFLIDVFHFSLKKSLLYSLFFFCNPLLLYYAFEARMYTMFAFFVVLSFYGFYTKKKMLYYVGTILGLYTHYFMIFALVIQGLILYLRHKITVNHFFSKHGLLSFIKQAHIVLIPFLFFIPWILFVLLHKEFSNNGFWILNISLKDIAYFPSLLYAGYERQLYFLKENQTYAVLFFISISILLIGIVGYKHTKNTNKHLLFWELCIWAFGPSLLLFIISFVYPIFLPRYLIICNVGLLFFLIYCLQQIKFELRLALIIILGITTLLYQNLQIKYRTKTKISPMYDEIKMIATKNDAVYVTSELDYFVAQYYFDENKVYVYNKPYTSLPSYVGKVLIPQSHLKTTLPAYPNRAFIINESGTGYLIQSLN